MKTWTKAEILELLRTNDRAVERALLTLYRRQTDDERAGETTRHENSVGFSQAHAHKFSSFAKQILKGYRLSAKQLAWCRYHTNGNTRIGRYWAQLVEEANANEARKAAAAQLEEIRAASIKAATPPAPLQLEITL